MGVLELLMIAVGLSMDAFAVAVCKGLGMKRFNIKHAVIIALFFGVFQGGMPLLGWLLGTQFASYITDFDHFIAFGLLAFLGGKMIFESIFSKDNDCNADDRLSIKEVFVMAIATSIDALAVGITFAFLQSNNILFHSSLIALTTFAISFLGVIIGKVFGAKFKDKAEIFGGAVLIFIGLKILLEHLGIISF